MKPLYLLALCCVLFSACTPLRVVRLEPAAADIDRMYYGNVIQSKEKGDVVAELSFYDATPRIIIFNLEVVNQGEVPFDFDPATIRMLPDVGFPVPAIDPELQLLGMDIEGARRLKNQRIFAAVGAGLMAVGAVAAVAEGGNNVDDISGISNVEVAADLSLFASDLVLATVTNEQLDQSFRYSVPPEEIPAPSSRFFWLDHALRITTIRPGERVMGKVAFLRVDEASTVDVDMDINGERFSFPFAQRVFRP